LEKKNLETHLEKVKTIFKLLATYTGINPWPYWSRYEVSVNWNKARISRQQF